MYQKCYPGRTDIELRTFRLDFSSNSGQLVTVWEPYSSPDTIIIDYEEKTLLNTDVPDTYTSFYNGTSYRAYVTVHANSEKCGSLCLKRSSWEFVSFSD